MGTASAAQRLAAELGELRTAAGVSLTKIEKYGRSQPSPVGLGRSKLSQWFNARSVPEKGRPFDLLIQLLEPAAERQSGTRPRGLSYWRNLRDEADRERQATGAGTPPTPAPADQLPVDRSPADDPDAETADKLLKLLPPGDSWFKWLRKAVTMFKVPLSVSNPVCDALEALEDDPVDYVDPTLQTAFSKLLTALTALCWELNGMTDISDEGAPVLEMSDPGTPAERNELNRQACDARDAFLPAYREMVNHLNAKGWLNRSTSPHQADAPVLSVELHAGFSLPDGTAISMPLYPVGLPQGEDIGGPYFFVVRAANKSAVGVEITDAGIEIDAGDRNGFLIPYHFPPRSHGGQTQFPYRLGGHAGFQSLSYAASLGHVYKRIVDIGGVPRRVRAWVAGERREGRWGLAAGHGHHGDDQGSVCGPRPPLTIPPRMFSEFRAKHTSCCPRRSRSVAQCVLIPNWCSSPSTRSFAVVRSTSSSVIGGSSVVAGRTRRGSRAPSIVRGWPLPYP